MHHLHSYAYLWRDVVHNPFGAMLRHFGLQRPVEVRLSSVLQVRDCQLSAQPRWSAIVSALQVEATTEQTFFEPTASRHEQVTWDAARQCLALALQCELRGIR